MALRYDEVTLGHMKTMVELGLAMGIIESGAVETETQ
jgi:hypothetical protein